MPDFNMLKLLDGIGARHSPKEKRDDIVKYANAYCLTKLRKSLARTSYLEMRVVTKEREIMEKDITCFDQGKNAYYDSSQR